MNRHPAFLGASNHSRSITLSLFSRLFSIQAAGKPTIKNGTAITKKTSLYANPATNDETPTIVDATFNTRSFDISHTPNIYISNIMRDIYNLWF